MKTSDIVLAVFDENTESSFAHIKKIITPVLRHAKDGLILVGAQADKQGQEQDMVMDSANVSTATTARFPNYLCTAAVFAAMGVQSGRDERC